MFGTLEKLYYFCGVQEQIDEFESNETFFETFHSNACIYGNYFVPLQRVKEQTITLNIKIMENFKSVAEFCGGISRGTFGISVIALTEPKMNKRGNPFYGRVHKASCLNNVALGYDYESVVNAKLERKGLAADFKAEKPKGKNWDMFPFLLQSDKDSSVKYLRCTMRKNTTSKSVYLLDGKVVSDDNVLAEIKSWISTSSYSPKQAESGLEEEEQVVVKDYKVEGIIALTQGEKVYNRLGGLISADALRKCFV